MDSTFKYLHLKHNGKNAFEFAGEITAAVHSPLHAMKKIREIFPHLSLTEAKEIVIMTITGYKNLDDYQGSLLPDLEEFGRILDEEEIHKNQEAEDAGTTPVL